MMQEASSNEAERLALVRDLGLVRDPPQGHDIECKRGPFNTLAVGEAKRCPNCEKDSTKQYYVH